MYPTKRDKQPDGSKTMNFQEWYNNEADMPALVNGEWVDLETGIPFSAWAPDKAAKQKKAYVLEINGRPAKASDGIAYARRLAVNQSRATAKFANSAESTAIKAYLVAAEAAVTAINALSDKAKKAEIAAAIRLNQAASRAANEIR
jgi:hypothetical protein